VCCEHSQTVNEFTQLNAYSVVEKPFSKWGEQVHVKKLWKKFSLSDLLGPNANCVASTYLSKILNVKAGG